MGAHESGPRVIVVGAGIAGLVAAREFVLSGREVILVEKADRLGGQIAKHSLAGIELDVGAEEFDARGTAMSDLLAALKLADDVVSPSDVPGWVHQADGSAIPLPAMSVLGIPGVPLAADVIGAVGMGAAMRAQLDTLLPSLVAAKAESLGELVRRRMGFRVLDTFVAPAVAATHGRSPDELSVEDAHPRLRAALLREGNLAQAVQALRLSGAANSLTSSLRGGLFRVVEALEAEMVRFGVDVRTGVTVVDFEADGVTTDAGERIEGEVLVACPPPGAAPTSRVQIATIAVDAPELESAPRGTGVFVSPGATDVAARSLTHLNVRWQWLSVTSPLHFIRLEYATDALIDADRAHADAEVLLGRPLPAPEDVAIVSWEGFASAVDPTHSIDGMRRVGEAESGTGLAAAVALSREVSRRNPSEKGLDAG